MTLKVTILGCGTSTGVPRIGPVWGVCDPANPKNRRTRCSLLVERQGKDGVTTILVDTTPDLRSQLLDAGVSWIDGVFYSHEHADHTHGIDDLRAVMFNGRKKVDVYFDEPTGALLQHRFAYCFETPEGSNYPAILKPHLISAGHSVEIEGAGGSITVEPFLQMHGSGTSLGFRFGDIAYSTDISALPEESATRLEGLDTWILDGLRYAEHPSHFCIGQALDEVERIQPKRAILTHLTVDVDYETLRGELPRHVEPAYDGMVIESAG